MGELCGGDATTGCVEPRFLARSTFQCWTMESSARSSGGEHLLSSVVISGSPDCF